MEQQTLITDDEVIAFVTDYLTQNGMPVEGVTRDSQLADLGLDSITTAALLISARDELTAKGRITATAAMTNIPPLYTVGDLADLMRGLAAASV